MSVSQLKKLTSNPMFRRFLAHTHWPYPKRRIILHTGEPFAMLYYITSASASIMIEDDDGNEMVLTYLDRGDFVRVIGLFKSGSALRS